MSEAKFTQGPWITDGDDIVERTGALCGVYIGVSQERGGGRLAETFSNCLVTTDEECRANADLIAAAPTLYEELASILQSIEGGGDVVTFQPVDVARYRSLLALARGEKK